jgi:hypothetical protein
VLIPDYRLAVVGFSYLVLLIQSLPDTMEHSGLHSSEAETVARLVI